LIPKKSNISSEKRSLISNNYESIVFDKSAKTCNMAKVVGCTGRLHYPPFISVWQSLECKEGEHGLTTE